VFFGSRFASYPRESNEFTDKKDKLYETANVRSHMKTGPKTKMKNRRTRLCLTALISVAVIQLSACTPNRFSMIESSNEPISENPSNGGSTETPPTGVLVRESFSQDEGAGKVDILVISDNSGSMAADQMKLGSKLQSFTSALSDIDWQIGITTTDLSNGPFGSNGVLLPLPRNQGRIITSKNPQAQSLFLQTVVRPEADCLTRPNAICGSGDEQPLRAIIRAIQERATGNLGFFRESVDLVALIISDEDEQSNGPVTATTPAMVVDEFSRAFGASKRFSVHGIIVQPGDQICLQKQRDEVPEQIGSYYGVTIAELVRVTQGSTMSICEPDYGPALQKISQSVRKLINSFELKSAPDNDKVVVKVNGSLTTAFKLEGKKLIFDQAPPANSSIEVEYRVTKSN